MRRPLKSKRVIKPDSKYNSVRVAKLINYVMKKGKVSIARNIVYSAFIEIEKITKKDPISVFETALANVGPKVELKPRRFGGANYQIPVEVSSDRRLVLSLRWILEAARTPKGESFSKKLAKQFVEASNNEGQAVIKKDNTHKMAEANRAFAHLAW